MKKVKNMLRRLVRNLTKKVNISKNIGDVKMHISPISSYRSDPYNKQTFTGRGFKAALAAGVIGVASLVAAPKIMAQTATPADSAKAQTTTPADSANIKPVVFAKGTFEFFDNYGYEEKQKLTLFVVNTKGDKSCFNAIIGHLYDYTTKKTYYGIVTFLIDKPYEERFLFQDLETSKFIECVTDADAAAWVKKYVGNIKWNKSGIVVETAEKVAKTVTRAIK